jgi:phosphatidate cytidylyltransferase
LYHPFGAYLFSSFLPEVKQQYLYYGLITFFAVGIYECVRIMKFDNGIYKWLVFPLRHLFITLYQTIFLSRFFLQCQSERDFGFALIPIAAITLFKFPRIYFEKEN